MIVKTIEEIHIVTNSWNGKEPMYADMTVNLSLGHTREMWKSGYLFFADNEVEETSCRNCGLLGYTIAFRRKQCKWL